MPVKSVQLNVLSNSRQARADLQDINAAASKLGAKVVTVKANVNDQTAGPFNVIERRVQRANGEYVIIKVRADAKDADLQLDNLERKVKALDGKTAKIDLKVGTGDLGAATTILAGFDKFITLGSKDAGGFSKAMAGINLATGILEPVIAGVTVATLALGSSLIAGGLGLGAYGLALLGPVSQLKNYDAALASASKTAAQKKLIADTPAQVKALAAALTGAQKSVTNWGDSLSRFTFAPILSGLKLVNPLLRDMTPFVKAGAAALSVLIGQLSKGVGSAGFAGWLKSELPLVKPAIVNLGDAIGHLVLGVMGIFHAFNPQAASMSKGLDDITKKFQTWGQTLGSHSGFQALMDMFKSDTPVIMNDLKQLGSLLIRTGNSMADLSTFANSRSLFSFVGVLLSMANALEKANPDLLKDTLYMLAFLDAVKKLNSGLTSLKSGVTTLHSVGTAISGLPGGLSNLKKGMNDSTLAASEASGAWGTFGGKIGSVKTGVGNLKGGMKDASVATADASGVMGTLGGKLAIVGSAIGNFTTSIFKASTYTKIWTGAQAALDVVMAANPVILIAAAVVILIGVLVLLAVKFKSVREFFVAAWHDILVAAQAVWGWLKSNWPLLVEIIGGPVAIAAIQIAKHFNDIKAFAFAVWAWIKNNWPLLLAILGGPIAVAALEIAKHFSTIEGWAKDVWNWIRGNWNAIENWLTSPIRVAAGIISNLASNIKNDFFNAVHAIEGFFSGAWTTIENGARGLIRTVSSIVSGIKAAFSGPINFVINDIWHPLATIWNKAAGLLHLPQLAEGGAVGKVTGGSHQTADDVLIRVSRDETVLSAGQSQLLGPQLRAAGVPGYAHGGGGPGPTNIKNPRAINTKLLPSGGIQDSFDSLIHAGEAGLAKMADWALTKIADVVFGPINALLGKIPGGNIVTTMMKDLVEGALKSLVGDIHNGAQGAAATIAAGPAGGATGGEMANGREIYNYLLQYVFGGHKIAAAGAIASIWGESTWNPFAQGTGGRGLIGWTPPGTISNADFSGGLRTQLPAVIRFIQTSGDEGVIAEMRGATSILQAANEWGKGVERYGINDVHSTGLSLAAQIMGNPGSAAAPKGGVSTSPVSGEQTFNGYSYAGGGIIPEHVIGVGMRSGMGYQFAENGPERVIPNGGGGDTYYITVAGDSDPDAAALRIIQKVRDYKRHHGNQPTNIG